jgi:exodeoxyribonuclease VII small subunit
MAKTRGETSGSKTRGETATAKKDTKNFEERLERLEVLGEKIRKTDIPLDEAIKAFEEGIKLARTLESDLGKIESRIEILMNSAQAAADEAPELELFDAEEAPR